MSIYLSVMIRNAFLFPLARGRHEGSGQLLQTHRGGRGRYGVFGCDFKDLPQALRSVISRASLNFDPFAAVR